MPFPNAVRVLLPPLPRLEPGGAIHDTGGFPFLAERDDVALGEGAHARPQSLVVVVVESRCTIRYYIAADLAATGAARSVTAARGAHRPAGLALWKELNVRLRR